MKNENKCFFSISLENGITITAQDADNVLNFLYDTHSAFFSLHEYYERCHMELASDSAIFTMTQIGNAIEAIKQITNTKQ